MYPGQHVDLLILLIQQVLQIFDFGLQGSHSFLQRLGITARERPTAQLVARLALEPNVGTLCAAGTNAIASDLFASASVAGLGNPTLCTGAADLDDFHRQDTRHFGLCRRAHRPPRSLMVSYVTRFVTQRTG